MQIEKLLIDVPAWLWVSLTILALWEMTWKAIGMWRAARKNQLAWFICIAVFNTIGILPIIYLLIQRIRPKTYGES